MSRKKRERRERTDEGVERHDDTRGRLPAAHPRGFRYSLWLHDDAAERRTSGVATERRLALVMTQLAAHGRTSVTKSCRPPNDGWRRSPLGGRHGTHLYLWWMPGTIEPAESARGAAPTPGILIRDIRHHDDHRPLGRGDADHYQAVVNAEAIEAAAGSRPWTDEQLAFAQGAETVRFINGTPGTGKTTALWLATDAHEGETVLYLTWSEHLVKHAREHFESFAPNTTTVRCLDFRRFLEIAAGRPVPAGDPSRRAAALAHGRAKADETTRRVVEAEARGYWFGRAAVDPRSPRQASDVGTPSLDTKRFETERTRTWGGTRRELGILADLLTAYDSATADEAWPELAAAHEARRRLERATIPTELDGVDRIVVDEVQDLTLVEFQAVLALCRRPTANARPVKLLVAGDSSQTVQSSGFEWGPYSALTARTLGTKPKRYQVENPARCPRRINETVERIHDKYADVPKKSRPGRRSKPGDAAAEETIQADLILANPADETDARDTVAALAELPMTAIVAPGGAAPRWLDAEAGDCVVNPETVKGLEYQTVCVLDPESALEQVEQNEHGSGFQANAAARLTLDRLNTACSRATEKLIFLNGPEAGNELSRSLLGPEHSEHSGENLVAAAAPTDLSADERADLYMTEAEALVEANWNRAWQRTVQAVNLLGDPHLSNSVADPTARNDIRRRALAVVACRTLDAAGENRAIDESIVYRLATTDCRADADENAGKNAEDAEEEIANLELRVTMGLLGIFEAENPSAAFFDTIEYASRLKGMTADDDRAFWPGRAFRTRRTALLESIARHAADPGGAPRIAASDLCRWLELMDLEPDGEWASAVTATAASTLLRSALEQNDETERRRLLVLAERTMDQCGSRDPTAIAAALEIRGRFAEAGAWYDEGRDPIAAGRCYRKSGSWSRARDRQPTAGTVDTVDRDLAWLARLSELTRECPPGLTDRMDDDELDRLFELFGRIWPKAAAADNE